MNAETAHLFLENPHIITNGYLLILFKEVFLTEVRDLYKRLVGANSKNLAFIELMVVDWVDKLLEKNNK